MNPWTGRQVRPRSTTWGLLHGAGDENRTRALI
ncbi:hypothetical protein G3I25_01330 [Streptomyces rochei]|nr:hypothetical protein [Streptomyces rochei]